MSLHVCARFCRGPVLVALMAVTVCPARSADLSPSPPRVLRYRPIDPAPAPVQHFYPADTPPASSNGYYGYYGYDIFGVPYEGLYSAESLCLHSVRTRWGYRTVDVCRDR